MFADLTSSIINYMLEYNRYLNILGIIFIVLISWLFSSKRSKISYKLVVSSLILIFVFGFCMLKTAWGLASVNAISSVVCALYAYTEEGARFVFGPLASIQAPWGFIIGFRVLPVIIFFGALMSLLFHWGIIQKVTSAINRVLYPLLGTSAAETTVAVANSFLGQTEAPLLIKNYVVKLTKSELFTVMVSGMATISAPLFAVYAAFGIPIKYILGSQIMAIPASILIAKLFIPETETPVTKHGLVKDGDKIEKESVFQALSNGTSIGLQIALAVGAMLIAFVALIACANGLLGWLSMTIQHIIIWLGSSWIMPTLSLQKILGVFFAPIAWILGFTGTEMMNIGELLGIKLVLNEMIAYGSISCLQLSERAVMMLSFVLCGFANFSSIGIQLAGIGALAPNQQKNLGAFGVRALFAASLVNILLACVAGLLL